MLTCEQAAVEIEEAQVPSTEAREKASEALAFTEALHQLFKDMGMTTKDEPDVNELENLVDALYGELGASVLFMCDPVYARVPDMLRVVGKQLEKMGADVPPTIVKGFTRLAKRIENTRVHQQKMALLATKAGDAT